MTDPGPDAVHGIRQLFDHAPCGLLACTDTGRLTEVNRTLESLTGLDHRQLLDGRRFQDLLTPAGRIYFETHFAPILRREGTIAEIALELRRFDGTRLPVLISATSAETETGGFNMAIFKAEDRRRYEQELLEGRRQEHEIASALAASLLSGELPADPDLTVDFLYQPSVHGLSVGGDWFDAFQLEGPGRRIALTVGDVVGRGLQAAATMGQLRSATRALAAGSHSAGQVLEALDRYVRRHGVGQMTTVVYAELDLDRRSLQFACAGHPPPLLLAPAGGASLLWGGRSIPLAAANDSTDARSEATVEIAPGSTILLYTDGLIERRDMPERDGLIHLESVAGDGARLPTQELLAALARTLRDPSDPDDMCILAARLCGCDSGGPGPDSEPVRMPSADQSTTAGSTTP